MKSATTTASARVAEYTSGGDKLHMAYCFELLGTKHGAEFIHTVLSRFEEIAPEGWPCWALTNHDVPRVATRWGGEQPNPGLLRLAAAMQLSLRGSPCLYQGDELGLPEAAIAFEDLQDPYGITMWPEYKGRDGCRTPMPWQAKAVDLGFSPDPGERGRPPGCRFPSRTAHWRSISRTARPIHCSTSTASFCIGARPSRRWSMARCSRSRPTPRYWP